jgi:hypothetical protein
MKPSKPSTPDLLACSPELATLDVLDTALTAASYALMAANPELESAEWVLEVPEPSVTACLSDAVIVNVIALQAALDRYRTYVVDHHHRRTNNVASDLDF